MKQVYKAAILLQLPTVSFEQTGLPEGRGWVGTREGTG